jgi:hypothetical protein
MNAATAIQLHHGGAPCMGRSAAGSESPTGVHVLNPGWSGGRGGSRQSRLGRVRLKMMIASTRQAELTVTCHWAGRPARGLQVRVICSLIAWPRWALPAVAVSQQSPRPASDAPGSPSLTPHRRAQSEIADRSAQNQPTFPLLLLWHVLSGTRDRRAVCSSASGSAAAHRLPVFKPGRKRIWSSTGSIGHPKVSICGA